jgi:homocysteine S-methyltransferase
VVLNISYPLLLDGGLSNQLESQGCDLNNDLWTAIILLRSPHEIVKAHTAYLNAGSQCITTASYQLTNEGLKNHGLDEKGANALILKSVDLAKAAVDVFMSKNPNTSRPVIAASVGPYGAYLADGSEYHGDYNVSDEALHEFHFQKIKLLDSSPADLLACETIPNLQEAKVLSKILKTCKKPAWMTFACKDESHLNNGSSINEAARLVHDNPQVFAIGVNCTHPKHISGLIKNLKSSSTDKRIIVYPNHGEVYDAVTKTWSKPTGICFNAEAVNEWINEGADIVGGCCRVGPEDIIEINLG